MKRMMNWVLAGSNAGIVVGSVCSGENREDNLYAHVEVHVFGQYVDADYLPTKCWGDSSNWVVSFAIWIIMHITY